MNRLPTTRQLSYLVALAQHASFRRAADSLGISQPALTQQMQNLEDDLGTPLIERRHGSVLLTPGGQALLEDAQAILQNLSRSTHRVRAIGLGSAGILRIGLTDDYFFSSLFEKIMAFIGDHPELEIETKADLSNTLLKQLSDRTLDIVFVNRPLMASVGEFQAIDLPASRIMLVVRKDHPFAKMKSVKPRALGDLKMILPPQEVAVPFFLQCQRLLEELPSMPQIVHRTSSPTLAFRMVANGFGAALLSEHSCDAGTMNLAAVPLDDDDAKLRHVVLVPRQDVSPAAELLIKWLGLKTPH
jgi:DNA-binding transcriptional LysR family regulator